MVEGFLVFEILELKRILKPLSNFLIKKASTLLMLRLCTKGGTRTHTPESIGF